MLAWLVENGGEYCLEIRTPAGGERGVFADRRIPKDGVIARIPYGLTLVFPPETRALAGLAHVLAREAAAAARGQSRLAPWLDALPMLRAVGHTTNMYNFPLEYLPLIKCKHMERLIASHLLNTAKYWEDNEAQLKAEGISFEQLQAALVTKSTRSFTVFQGGASTSIMIPLQDFANHYDNCSNYWDFGRCDTVPEAVAEDGGPLPVRDFSGESDPDRLCVFWRAGREILEGEELCYKYKTLSPDMAMFQFGFILPDDPPAMSLVDLEPFPDDQFSKGAETRAFDGTTQQLKAERWRVKQRIKELEALAEEEAAMKPAPSDPTGAVLGMLKILRQQRLAALRNEAKALKDRVASKAAAAAGSGPPSGGATEE